MLTLLLLVLLSRRYLYDMTSKWLTGGSNYKVDRVYVWNAGENGWSCCFLWGRTSPRGGVGVPPGGRSPARGDGPPPAGQTQLSRGTRLPGAQGRASPVRNVNTPIPGGAMC